MPFRQWVLLAALVVAGHARAAEALPWKFGMSPDDVRAVLAVGQGTRNFIAPAGSVGKPAYGILKREQIEGKPVYFVILHFDLAP